MKHKDFTLTITFVRSLTEEEQDKIWDDMNVFTGKIECETGGGIDNLRLQYGVNYTNSSLSIDQIKNSIKEFSLQNEFVSGFFIENE